MKVAPERCRPAGPWWAVLLMVAWAGASPAAALAPPQDIARLSAEGLVTRALVGTLYYDFETWLPEFSRRINELEGAPQTLETRMDLMRYHFFQAGLLAELSHVLSFTSKFKVDSVKNGFDHHSKQAKAMAQQVLETPDISDAQRAEGFFYLGVSEGYIGILQYGAGNYLSALINGLSADNHLEDALRLNPRYTDAYVGLGIYQYGNTRLGGLANFIMQGGEDLRLQGLRHIERALKESILSRPLALKTLIWFYISEEINPDNAALPADHPLSRDTCRRRTLELMERYESAYFKKNAPAGFIGNKGLAMMKAIQFVIDRDYRKAREAFEQVLTIATYLKEEKKYSINPQLTDTVREGIKFCDLMITAKDPPPPAGGTAICGKIQAQIAFIENGGSLVEYESEKIRGEIQNVFYRRLKDMARQSNC